MFLNSYIKEYGKYSFAQRPFNDVDALVLSEISYLNLDRVINKKNDGSFVIKDIDLSNIDELTAQQSDMKKNKIMLPLLMKAKRYKDLVISDVEFRNDNEEVCQFYAITIFFEDKMFLSFRGTDLTLRGWKENLEMSYKNIIPGHNEAIRYTKKILKKYDFPFYLGGHSKGGNLAVYAGIKMPIEHYSRLQHIYTFDGPGFFDEKLVKNIEESPLHKKIIKYVPKESVVGIVLKHTKTAKIVDAVSVGVLQHDPFNWKINDDGTFKLLKRRAVISYINEKSLNNWLDSLKTEDILLMSDILFASFDDLSIDLIQIKKNWWDTFHKIHQQYLKLSKEDRYRVRDIWFKLIKSNAKSTVTLIKEQTNKNRKKKSS